MVDSAGWFWQHGQVTGKGVEIPCNSKADVGNFKRTCELVQGRDTTFYDTEDRNGNRIKGRETILHEIIMPEIFKDSQCPGEKENKSLTYIDFYIYKQGRIEKYIPKEETFLARYYYHEENGTKHYLGTTDFHKETWKKSATWHEKSHSQLANVKNLMCYSSGSIKYKILKLETTEQHRYYIDIDVFAAYLGAFIENSTEDIIFRGCSDIAGNAGDSKSHFNGINADFAYFNFDKKNSANLFSSQVKDKPLKDRIMSSDFDYERQKLFCKALNKWGFAKFKRTDNKGLVKLLTEYFYKDGKQQLIDENLCSDYTSSRHYHHLHVQGLDITNEDFFKTIKEN